MRNHLSKQSLHPGQALTLHTPCTEERRRKPVGSSRLDLTGGSPRPSRIGASLTATTGTPRVAVTPARRASPSTDRTGETSGRSGLLRRGHLLPTTSL